MIIGKGNNFNNTIYVLFTNWMGKVVGGLGRRLYYSTTKLYTSLLQNYKSTPKPATKTRGIGH